MRSALRTRCRRVAISSWWISAKFLAPPQFAGYSDLQFCEWVIRNVGVAAVPGSSFFREDANNFMRLHFAR